MKNKILFYISCFVIVSQQHAADRTFFEEPLTEYTKKDWEKRGACNKGIKFLKDANEKLFVLKFQHTPETAIHDILGAQMGVAINIPVNQVIFLPANLSFFKESLPYTATLHSHASGQEVKDVSDMPYYIDIKNGLFEEINLKSITYNIDLCDIIALHIYCNKNDGHLNNLIFDKKTNRFCAIDYGNIFHTIHNLDNNDCQSPYDEENDQLHNIFPAEPVSFSGHYYRTCLASEAYDFIKTLEKEKLTPEKINALNRVDTVLNQLMSQYPASKMYDEWMKLAEKINYTYSPDKKECIKVAIEYNEHEVKRLRLAIADVIKAQIALKV